MYIMVSNTSWLFWVTWRVSYTRQELQHVLTILSYMAGVLYSTGTATRLDYFELHDGCSILDRNCNTSWLFWVTWQVSYTRQELLTLHEYLPPLSCVLCAQSCQCVWTVHSWLPLRFSLWFICSCSKFHMLHLKRL